jgi:diguanylate cyclase (GGDEF)-like protein
LVKILGLIDRLGARVWSSIDAAQPCLGRESDRKRNQVLDMIAQNERLEAVLERLAELVETQCPEALCTMLLLRNSRLCHASARRLPAEIVQRFEGMTIGPAGTATGAPFWSHGIRTSDIASDPHWLEHRAVALGNGLRGCWSRPIMSGAGEILGTLVIYLPVFRAPAEEHLQAMEEASRLAGIAIEQRHMVDELNFKTHHDSLTRLANRVLFDDRLQQAISMADRGSFALGLLRIDLDRFKTVNDLLGSRAGDALLARVARRLKAGIRKTDTLARTGGDEFTLLLVAIESPEGAYAVAQKLLESLAEPFLVDGHELFVTASIGVSAYPLDAHHAAALERNADDALYRAKADGRNMWQPFQQEISTAACKRLELETHLRGALARGELSLHYQPQVNLRDGRVEGVEALLRWKHKQLGMVSPASFIPVAEETGLIVPIGEWVLEEACAQSCWWRDAGMPIKVSVNVSAVQFVRADFAQSVERVLLEYAMDPALLELELTESAVMRDVQQAARHMEALRRLGIRIAIDDFGTGYSSLSYLQRLPIDVLKLDQIFVRALGPHGDKPELAQSIVALARALGKQVIAEGVETQEHLDALLDMQCDVAQGFLLGRPMSPDELQGWLAAREATGATLLQAVG